MTETNPTPGSAEQPKDPFQLAATGRQPAYLRIPHIAVLALLSVIAVIHIVLGGVLANRSLLLGLAFAAAAAFTLIGLWKRHLVALAVGCAGMVFLPYVAEAMGAATNKDTHLVRLMAVGLLFAIWVVTRPKPGQAV